MTVTESLQEAEYIEFIRPERYPSLRITSGKKYRLHFGSRDPLMQGGEFYVIDDEEKVDWGSLMVLSTVLYK